MCVRQFPVYLALAGFLVSVEGINKDVVAHISCQTCSFAVDALVYHAGETNITEEDAMLDIVDGLCSVKKDQGKWVARVDIVESMKKPGELELITMPDGIGYCKSECISVQRACQSALKSKEDALSSMVLEGEKGDAIKKKVCKKTCSKKLPKLENFKDEPWKARDAKEVEAEERVAKMEAETGQKFKMWSKEQIASMSQADIELEAAKDALGHQRREVELAKKAEKGEL